MKTTNITAIRDLIDSKDTSDTQIREILEPLLISAGLKDTYLTSVHEILRWIGDTRRELDNLIKILQETRTTDEIVIKLTQILKMVDNIETVARGVGKITRKIGQEIFPLSSVIKDVIDIMNLRLKKNNISIEIQEKEKIEIQGLKNKVVTALLNLIDNSSYWLLHRASERKIIIRVDHNGEGKPRIIVSDNGPGIKDDISLLVQPFYTRRSDGMGLGLYIVDRMMKDHDGNIQILSKGDENGLLEGTNIALVFSNNCEVMH